AADGGDDEADREFLSADGQVRVDRARGEEVPEGGERGRQGREQQLTSHDDLRDKLPYETSEQDSEPGKSPSGSRVELACQLGYIALARGPPCRFAHRFSVSAVRDRSIRPWPAGAAISATAPGPCPCTREPRSTRRSG